MGLKYSSFAIRGIDVSVFNGTIDWTKVSANFSGIRVGYGRTIDTRFKSNWLNSKGKVNRIPYWYMDYYNNHISTHPAFGMTDEAWGQSQAEFCWATLKDDPSGAVMLDIESTNGNYAPKIETVPERAQAIAKAFLERMDELNKKRNGIYCSLGLLSWFSEWFKDRPLWVAWYPYRSVSGLDSSDIVYLVKKQGWKVAPLIWQYASDGDVDDNGSEDGLSMGMQYEFLDLNGWVGTPDQYSALFGGPVVVVPTPEPEPEYIPGKYQITAQPYLFIREGMSATSNKAGRYDPGAKVNISRVSGDWGLVEGQQHFIYLGYAEKIS